MRSPSVSLFLLALTLLFTWSGLNAQVHHLEPVRAIRTETGVPSFLIRGTDSLGLSTSPTDMHLMPDGRILVFAQQTIALGDGTRWETFRQAEEDPPSVAASVAVSPDGTIYAGAPGGIGRIEICPDRRWRARIVAPISGSEAGSLEVGPRRVCVSGDEWLWHSTSGPIRSWKPGQPQRTVGQADAISDTFFFQGAHYFSNRTDGELFRLKSGVMEKVPIEIRHWIDDTITCALPLGDRQMLVGTFRQGMQLFDGKRVTPFVTEGPLASPARINALCVAGDDLFVAAVDNMGIVFFTRQGHILQVLDRTVDHRLSFVRLLISDLSGTIWGLLKEGIIRIDFPGRVSDFVPLFGAPINTANVCRFNDQLWFMADGQLYRGVYDRLGRLTGTKLDTPPEGYVSSLSYASNILVAGSDHGSYYWTKEGWVHFAPTLNNLRIVQDQTGNGPWLYLAKGEVGWLHVTSAGIRFEPFPVPDLDNFFHVEADANGEYWAELGNGKVGRLQIREGKPQFRVFGQEDGLPLSWCQIFVLDGVMRVNVAGTTVHFDSATQRFNIDQEFLRRFAPFKEINCRPGRDASGRIWMVADRALRILRDTPAGMVSDPDEHLVSERQPYYLAFEPNGVVWMQEDSRLYRYDPAVPEPPARPLLARITNVSLPFSDRDAFPSNGTITPLSYTDNSLVAHFVALGATLNASIEFEVMLEGVDTKWNPVGSSGSAAFKHLPEGDYKLHIRPRLGERIGVADTLAFTIQPPWFRTYVAYSTYCLLTIGFFIALIRIPALMQRRERERLERLVNQRTQQLHETNAQLASQLSTIRSLSQAIEQSPTAVALTRADGIITYANPCFCELTGYSATELVGRAIHTLYSDHTAPHPREEITEKLAIGESWHGQLMHLHKDGHILKVRAAYSPILSTENIPLSHLILEEDITAWIEEQERRQNLEKQLSQAQKLESLGTLAGGIAHDFNNILTTILGCCELVQLSSQPNDPNAEMLNEIHKAGIRAKDLVLQILTFSRKSPTVLVPLEMRATVADALKIVRASAPSSVVLSQDLETGSICADATQIFQVVVNLCTNAVHALPDRTGNINVTVGPCELGTDRAPELHELAPGPYMCLRVSDTGHGMDADTLSRIFDPFFTTKKTGEGTGLGLAIVQGIVANHKGGLLVRSAIGAGTSFELYFPRTKATPSQVVPSCSTPTGEKQEILVVDDEQSVAKFVIRRLEQLGYHAVAFSDPCEALAASKATPSRFNAVITDLTMPQMTGIELLQQMHANGLFLPSIIITGYHQDLAQDSVNALPNCVVLQKPFDGEQLGRLLAKMFHSGNGAKR